MFATHRPIRIPTWPRLSGVPALRHTGHTIGTILGRLSILPYDSREPLPSKDLQMASFGVSWPTDPSYEIQLARELENSLRHRLAEVPARDLHLELERMSDYAAALETRCNVLWSYVPGNQGNQDPVVPFIAENIGIRATSAKFPG